LRNTPRKSVKTLRDLGEQNDGSFETNLGGLFGDGFNREHLRCPRALGANDPPEAKKYEVFADVAKPGSPVRAGSRRDGKIIYAKGFGLRTSKKRRDHSENLFDIGSTSNNHREHFAAGATRKTFRQRRRPQIHSELPITAKIALLNLLNHTSGIRDYLAC